MMLWTVRKHLIGVSVVRDHTDQATDLFGPNRAYLVLNNEGENRHWCDKRFEGLKALEAGMRW